MKFNIIHIPKVDSTNSYAHQLITSGAAKQGDIITAEFQTLGKGQGDNFWESEAGKNLTMSIIIEPIHLEASNQFVITQLVSLAIWEAMNIYLKGHKIHIKWPNDIYVGNRKLGGVLIQNFILGSSISFSIMGIGININQEDFLSDAPNPVSMFQLTSGYHQINHIRDTILNGVREYFSNDMNSTYTKDIKERYLEKLYRKDELSAFIDSSGTFNGKIKDVDEFGRLIITKESGIGTKYLLKEVKMII